MRLRVNVNLVQLNVAVTDSKGNYITGLRPEDFVIMEDKVPQKLNTFEEGNFNPGAPGTVPSPRAGKVAGTSGDNGQALPSISSSGVRISPLAGADVFILFDTSNYMYRGFVFAQDAITDFVRSHG